MATGDAFAWQPGSIYQPSGYQFMMQQTGTTYLGQATYAGYFASTAPSGTSGVPTSQSNAASLPEPSLVGQAWGRIIPITAGHRTIPGRPVWRKLTANGDGTYSADAAISFGWRAEMRSGDNDAALSWSRFLANGIILGSGGAVAVPDISLVFRDGTQTTQDVLDPSEDQPAFIFHVMMYVFGLPLSQFGNVFPDAWDLDVFDTVEGIDGITLARAIRLLYGQTRLLNGKVDVATSVTDAISALFIVEQGAANDFGRSISRACGLDMRENVDRLEFIRAVDIADYTVNLTVPDSHLIRPQQGATVTYTRTAEQRAAATLDLQFVADEATFKFTSRPARRIVSPVETTTSTKGDTIRIPLGMPLNRGQTYVSLTLFRETEARSKVDYRLPWEFAISAQVGDVQEVLDGTDLITVKVVRADRPADRTVSISAERLHTQQDYVGVADVGTFLVLSGGTSTQGAASDSGFTPQRPPQTIGLPFISSAAVVYAPLLTERITGSFIASTAVVYAPTIQEAGGSIAPPFIGSTATAYAPSLTERITGSFIASSAVVYAPTLVSPSYLLLEDGASHVLQEDGTSKIILE